MKTINCIGIVMLLTIFWGYAFADDKQKNVEGSFARAEVMVQGQLEEGLAELSALRELIADEKSRLTASLTTLKVNSSMYVWIIKRLHVCLTAIRLTLAT